MAVEANPYPRNLEGHEITPELRTIVMELARRLVQGQEPQHLILRDQLAIARVTSIQLTGHGLFADLECSGSPERVEPRRMIGGLVALEVKGLEHGAGSLLIVADGVISCVEIYAYAEAFPDAPEVLTYQSVEPVPVNS